MNTLKDARVATELTKAAGVKPGDVIQIKPDAELKPCWIPVLLIVERVEIWGVRATGLFAQLGRYGQPPAHFPCRLTYSQFTVVGPAPYVPVDIADGFWPKDEPDD